METNVATTTLRMGPVVDGRAPHLDLGIIASSLCTCISTVDALLCVFTAPEGGASRTRQPDYY